MLGRAMLASHHFAYLEGLLLHAVQEAARPDKFCGQNAQSQSDDQPAGSRGNDHYDPESQKRESENDLKYPLGLIESGLHPLSLSAAAGEP
jgi:hypothetical protein